MRLRLEETQSRLMTQDPAAANSPASPGENDVTMAGIVSTAPSTLKRRTIPTTPGDNNVSNGQQNGQQNGGSAPEKWTAQVKPIISRLKLVEHELQEELNSSAKKQQIIDAQQKRIDMLMSANERLMATLSQLKDRYIAPEDGGSPGQDSLDANGRQVFRQNHSKISPLLSASSSASGASSNEEESRIRDQRFNSGQSSESGHLTSVTSDLSSVESYCFVHGSPVGSPSSSCIVPRSTSPQPPPQPNLPAPVLPQQRPQQNSSSDQYVAMKTTEC